MAPTDLRRAQPPTASTDEAGALARGYARVPFTGGAIAETAAAAIAAEAFGRGALGAGASDDGQGGQAHEGEDTMQNSSSAVPQPEERSLPGAAGRRERLVEASKVRDEALAMVGHDLRTPPHTIRVTLKLLLKSGWVSEDACRKLEIIDRAADRMLEMIGSIIDFAESQFTGSLRVVPVPANLFEVGREAIDELIAAAPGRRVAVEVAGKVGGTWDPARLKQVVSNLVANALKHGGGRGPVKVSLRGYDDDVVLGVGCTLVATTLGWNSLWLVAGHRWGSGMVGRAR